MAIVIPFQNITRPYNNHLAKTGTSPDAHLCYLVFLLVPETQLQNLSQFLPPLLQVLVQLPSPVLQKLKEAVDLQTAALSSLDQLRIHSRSFTLELFYEVSQLLAFV